MDQIKQVFDVRDLIFFTASLCNEEMMMEADETISLSYL